MTEYIKREDVLALQTELRFDKTGIEQLKHYRCRHIDPDEVKLLPAVDVIKNAFWQFKGDDIRCSACNGQAIYTLVGFCVSDYCPNCGARMNGVVSANE